MLYLVTLFILLSIYIIVIIFMKKMKNTNLFNLLFCLVALISYLSLVLIVYLDVGFYNWNFQNTLPTANISPFMFSTIPIYFILPKKIKKYYLGLISLLSLGMLVAAMLGCIYNFSINYLFHPHFLLDYLAHISLSLWGIYIVKTKQIELKIKDSLISGSIIVVVAFIMMLTNLIFDTSFFGLSLTGKHNIYNNILVDNSYLSALIYFSGVAVVLFLGFVFQKFIIRHKK